MEKICFITNKYPNRLEENILVFVQQLVWTINDLGVNCEVICPVPINLNLEYIKFPDKITEVTENGTEVNIYFPKYIGFGQSYIGNYNTAKITTNSFTKAVGKVIKKMDDRPEAVYGHFVTPAGIAAAVIGKKYGIPSFLAYGEATLNTINHYGLNEVKKKLSTLSGVVSVSSHNKDVLSSIKLVDESIIGVFPNGYREQRFYPKDKTEARKRFKLPQDKFIISFVGSYDHRKGIERVIEALNQTNDVYLISAGKGKFEIPENDKVLFKGKVNNEDLPDFLSASDAFILPTLQEGCSNAIIEAMACGLPVISSDLPFNDDILDNSNSIKIDPMNIQEIKNAINKLKDNIQLRNTLANGSLIKSKSLTLNLRANNIIEFISKKVVEYKNDK